MVSKEAKRGVAVIVGGILLVVGILLVFIGFKFRVGAVALPSIIPALLGYMLLKWAKEGR